jgi:hypothetical protein
LIHIGKKAEEEIASYLLIRNHNLNGDEYADAKGAWTDYRKMPLKGYKEDFLLHLMQKL